MAFFSKDKIKKDTEEFRYGEDEEIWEEEEPRARRYERMNSRGRRIGRVLIVLLAAALAVGLWMNRDSLAAKRVGEWFQTRLVGLGVGDGYPASIIGSKVLPTNLRTADGSAVMLSDTSLSVLNPTAKVLMSRQHSFSEPRLCMAGGSYLVYNLGGPGYRVETISKTELTGNADGDIQCAALAPNGRFALGTSAEGNASRLTVYLSNGSVQYTYSFYDAYITAAALNRDGTGGLVSAVSTAGGELLSTLYLFDFSREEPVASYVMEDNLTLFLNWTAGGGLTAVGDRSAVYGRAEDFSQNKPGALKEYDYAGTDVTAYADSTGGICLALFDGTTSTVVCMDGLNEPSAVSVPQRVTSVSIFEGSAALLEKGTVTVLDTLTGAVLAETDVGRDAEAVALSGESTAYILGVSEIKSVDFDAPVHS